MYNHYLDTFIQVADSGSFSKAAEILYISPTAVSKKISNLELEIGITLFQRTHQGVVLTNAGKALYQDAKKMIEYSNLAIARAKSASYSDNNIIRMGKSLNTPCDILTNIWPKIRSIYPELKLSIISFENTTQSVNKMFENLGTEIDMYIGLFDSNVLAQRKCIGLRLSEEPLKIAVPYDHRLAQEEILSFQDLYGEKLMLVQRGRFLSYDRLRIEIEKAHPKIEIVDCETIKISAFNECENIHSAIVIIEPWKNIHPLFKTIPVNWEYSTPFGIVCSKMLSLHVEKFLHATKQIFKLDSSDYFE